MDELSCVRQLTEANVLRTKTMTTVITTLSIAFYTLIKALQTVSHRCVGQHYCHWPTST